MAVDFAQLRATTLNRPSVVSSLVSLGRAILGLQTDKAGKTQTRLVRVPLLAAGPMNGYILDTETVTVADSGLTGTVPNPLVDTPQGVTFAGTTIGVTSTSRANPPVSIGVAAPDGVSTVFGGGTVIPAGLSAATTPTARIRFNSNASLNDVYLTPFAFRSPLGAAWAGAGGGVPVAKAMGALNEGVEVSVPLSGVASGDSVFVSVLFDRGSASDTNTGTVFVTSITLEYSVTETLAV